MTKGWLKNLSGLILTTLAVAPSAAWACPYCAVREGGGTASTVLMGAMIALPFGIAFAVVPAIRRVVAEPDFTTPTLSEARDSSELDSNK